MEAQHAGDSNFNVQLVPSVGDFDDLFLNQIGDWEGEKAELIEEDTYTIDVEADGDWSLTLSQPRSASGESLPANISNDISSVYGPFEFEGSHVALVDYPGDSNLIIRVLPGDGMSGELVINETGQHEGETTFQHDGVGWVAVQADDSWAVDIA